MKPDKIDYLNNDPEPDYEVYVKYNTSKNLNTKSATYFCISSVDSEKHWGWYCYGDKCSMDAEYENFEDAYDAGIKAIGA